MKLYRTEGYIHSDNPTFTWQGTLLTATAERKRLTTEGYLNVQTVEVDVPTDKPGLLAFLNKNVTGK